jgi:hypothetical protein
MATLGRPPMFDRGDYFAGIKAKDGIAWPVGWTDPDQDWYAEKRVEDEAAAVHLRRA